MNTAGNNQPNTPIIGNSKDFKGREHIAEAERCAKIAATDLIQLSKESQNQAVDAINRVEMIQKMFLEATNKVGNLITENQELRR